MITVGGVVNGWYSITFHIWKLEFKFHKSSGIVVYVIEKVEVCIIEESDTPNGVEPEAIDI